jgi:ribosome-associated protein
MLLITPNLALDEAELVETFVRASGPGGQNVNKVSSAVELRFDIKNSPSLPDWVKEKLLQRRDRRITQDGVMVIQAQRLRTQDRNREDARERLLEVLREATFIQAKRVATKPSRAAKARRVDAKKTRAGVKKLRSKVGPHE